jgi:hypothetical protein
VDVDFLVSRLEGYRELRQRLSGSAGIGVILKPGEHLAQLREVRVDQYGIRTLLQMDGAPIKFEIVLEGRIELEPPGPDDRICGVATLTPMDMATSKLLANADRWRDDAVFSRDLIDLAMHPGPLATIRAACAKAEGAYGADVRRALAAAIEALRRREGRLEACMRAMAITGVSRAQLWQRIRRLERWLAPA